MRKIKRLYIYILQTFLPFVLMTFGICLFIVLMQFLWRFIDYLVGKGLDISVLSEFFIYAAASLVPMSLPLSILLASLMTFGNLGEKFELLAMKAAGVSLFRIMRPLIIFLFLISVGVFFYQNIVTPIAQVKLYSLIYAMKQKSPELEIPEGSFYSEISGFNLYVKHKEKDGLLRDLMIYDYSEGFNNARVILADSGRLKMSEDKMFLIFSLFNGESFENLKTQSKAKKNKAVAVPYRRETFGSRDILIQFDANFNRTDEGLMANMFIGKNLKELQLSIDSMGMKIDSLRTINSNALMKLSYKKSMMFSKNAAQEKDSLVLLKKETEKANLNKNFYLNFDSLYYSLPPVEQSGVLTRARSYAENLKNDNYFKAATLGNEAYTLRRHYTEWHKRLTVCVACLLFFFIGAPLGAIIRKGGLGVPVVLSIFIYITYYVIDTVGYKMARDGRWEPWEGMWLSSFVLLLLGAFFTYKAVNDSVILDISTYTRYVKRLFGKSITRNIQKKEVIIYEPNYSKLKEELNSLLIEIDVYLKQKKRYFSYWSFSRNRENDKPIAHISDKLEQMIEECSNSDNILLLNKLMDYPVLKKNYLYEKIGRKIGLFITIIFPLGFIIYLISVYRHKILLQDLLLIRKTSEEILEIMK